jgi:sialidase-1
VMLNIRNENRDHRRAISISKDGAHRWSAPTLHPELKEPVCMANVLRYNFKTDEGPGRILFSNPDNLEYSGKAGPSYDKNRDRVNLTIKMSLDDGKTWPVSRVVEPGISAYSDLAVAADGSILCLYERGGVDNVMWDTKYVTLARFNLEWLQETTADNRTPP